MAFMMSFDAYRKVPLETERLPKRFASEPDAVETLTPNKRIHRTGRAGGLQVAKQAAADVQGCWTDCLALERDESCG